MQALLKKRQDEVRERNRQIEDGVFAATNDPTPPAGRRHRSEAVPPALNFAPLENASAALTDGGRPVREGAGSRRPRGSPETPPSSARVNAQLIRASGSCSTRPACPHREWYRHLLYAPGFYTGYGVKTLPGVREGIEQRQYAERRGRGRARGEGARSRNRPDSCLSCNCWKCPSQESKEERHRDTETDRGRAVRARRRRAPSGTAGLRERGLSSDAPLARAGGP